MTVEQLPYLLLLVIPLTFALLWLGITLLLGVISGWTHLQQRYPDRREEPIERLRWQYAGMGKGLNVNFNNCVTMELCPGGMRFAIPKLLGPRLRPFFVPWSEIAAKERTFLGVRSYQITFGADEGAMTVRPTAWEKIAACGFLRA